MKKIVFTQHTKDSIRERGFEPDWVILAVVDPEWTERDPYRHDIERRFRSVPEFGNRVLRVACFETSKKSV